MIDLMIGFRIDSGLTCQLITDRVIDYLFVSPEEDVLI